MARGANTAQAYNEFPDYRIERRDFPIRIGVSPDPDEEVYISGNFDASDQDPTGGTDVSHAMTLNGNFAEITVPNLIVGRRYEYQIIYFNPTTGNQRNMPSRHSGRNETFVVSPAEAPSPSRTHPLAEVQTGLKKRVTDILNAARKHDTAENLKVLFDVLKDEMDGMGITDDQTPVILNMVAEVIFSDKKFPAVVRKRFSKDNPPTDFDDLQQRLNEGALEYEKKVFTQLKLNPAARKRFHLDTTTTFNEADPLHNPQASKVFRDMCGERTLRHLAPRIGMAMESITNVPARDPTLDAERQAWINDVVNLLTPAEISEAMHPKKRSKLAEFGIQAGLVTAGVFAPGTAILAWLAKGLGEGLSGVHMSDFAGMSAGDLKKQFMRNNVVTRWLKTGDSLGKITTDGIKDWAQRSIPVYGAKYAGETGHEASSSHAQEGSATDLIKAACEKATA
ncbi:MAG: hypothetical protein AAB588_02660 [Patescibacteria group bacterium]